MDHRNLNRRSLLGKSIAAATGVLVAAVGKSASAQSAPAAPPAVASGRLKTILDRGTVIVGTRSTTIGFGFKDPKGDLVGFDVDLAREIARGLFNDPGKVQFEVFNGGAERAPALDSGRVDLVVSQFSVLEARAQVLDFSVPYCNSDLGAVVRASSPYRKYADLNNKKVSTRQAEEVRQLIVAAVPKADVQMFPAFSDAFLAFRQGRVEAFFSDGAPMRYIMREFGNQFRVINDPSNLLDANQFSIGLKQGDQVLLNYVNWALVRMRLTGRLAAIHRQWLGTEDLIPAWARGPI